MNKKLHISYHFTIPIFHHFTVLLMVLCLSSLGAHAQESSSRQIYLQAESEYAIGHIEQAIQLLQDNLASFEGNLKQSVCRLLALCYLSEDQDEEARYYAEQLVKLNNYYNSTDDPARFQDLINKLKDGITTTITTASSQSESINEAPVPITIITAEMIEELGYNKNLAHILEAYVPGIAEVASLEEGVNLSMHGAYANGQEYILIMENGHRLNTRFDNTGPVSYSVSTEKIDHIEVLRGPASSLYGNVALSAVVNIITKNGRSADGVKAKYGYGSFNTHKADFTMGTQFMDADIFAWASIYNSDGQKRSFGDGKGYYVNRFSSIEEYEEIKRVFISPDITYVDVYKDTPSYDVGLTFKLKGFDLLFSKKSFNKVMQHTMFYGGYNYDKYPPVCGTKPGKGMESVHAEIGYSKQFRKLFLNASLYSDWYSSFSYKVQYDSLVYTYPAMEGEEYVLDENGNFVIMTEEKEGEWAYTLYKEHTMGGVVKASADYLLGSMKGNLLAGGQFEHFSLLSGQSIWGKGMNINEGYTAEESLIDYGKDNSLSFFIQDKHYFLPQLILNAGFRYDLKYRQEDDVVKTFSPRLSMMYVPNGRFSLKLSYSEAFADLSFYDRYITKSEYYTLDPQHLSAVQLTAMGTIPSVHLNYEANFFYNKYSNLFCYFVRDNFTGKNSGQLKNAGIECSASYAFNRFSANFSLYYSKDISSQQYNYNVSRKMVCGVPHFMLNLHGAWKLVQTTPHELKVYSHFKFNGRKLNYEVIEIDDAFVSEESVFDLGVKYCYKQQLQLSLDCENIFDTYHYICGTNYLNTPLFQRGRTLIASLSYRF